VLSEDPEGAQPARCALSALRPGQQAVVVNFTDRDDRSVQRLMHLGLLTGRVVELVRRAPTGDPIEIRLLDFALSLRLREARLVEVEPIP
jgi:Fe2+ transport system protein FeoA